MRHDPWSRRRFLARCAGCAAGFAAIDAIPWIDANPRPANAEDLLEFAPQADGQYALSDYPAAHWETDQEGRVICKLCPRECRVADRERGNCGVRENHGGGFRSLVHSRPCTYHVDPIEKKPFFHVWPASEAFSIATAGCNLQCRFCQNWEISQFRPEQIPSTEAPPQQIITAAKRSLCRVIASTYSEPVVFYEYVRDIAILGNEQGIKSVMVSSGYIQEKPLRELLPHLAAVKIDLKGFTEDYYREVCSGKLAPVQKTLEVLKETRTWFEIVVLVVPTLNDDEKQMRALCGWVADHLGPEVPVHFTRFHPAYRLTNLPSTPVKTLERIHGYAREAGLSFAYIGNVRGHPAENTVCPTCGEILIRRIGYTILENRLEDGKGSACARPIPGLWEGGRG